MTPLWSSEVEARIRAETRSLDTQIRPNEVKYCVRCVVSNQRPRIIFDDEGVCSACRFAERKKSGIDWKAREEELAALLAKHRRKSGHDVIVPSSGGKDSAFVAHTLKTKYGMNPLCVKWAPFIYTDIGRKNFDAFIQSGFDCLVAYPNGLIHRKLARLAFEFLGDAFQPFAFGQLNYPMHMAKRFDIPLVFFGENGEAEYGGDPSANDKPCWDYKDWERVYLKGNGIDALLNMGVSLGAFTQEEISRVSEFYRLPTALAFDNEISIIGARNLEFHWLGYYMKWHPQRNYYLACENTGFQANPDGRSEGTYSKYASLDDKTDGFHYFMSYIKFGLGRATSDAAHEIRDGDRARDEGVSLVKRYDGEFPRKHFGEFLEYLGMSESHFWRVVDRYRPEHLWEQANGTWNLKHGIPE